ncbi:hypothetical protein E2C01_033417 [Portunus trituberculatus]|uniref:Uncharacterized protein n=1 Tax=Portunus trituberculatus TaxID=210409 RepID=A0A5B7F3D2_PORTR|nr:hypothetical protein [Portunus trituberculatus]
MEAVQPLLSYTGEALGGPGASHAALFYSPVAPTYTTAAPVSPIHCPPSPPSASYPLPAGLLAFSPCDM